MNTLMVREGRLPKAENGGLFISSGSGRHGRRRLESFEIILMRSGKLVMREENEVFTLNPSDLLLLIPGREHQGLSDYEKDTSFYWVHFRLAKKEFQIRNKTGSKKGYISISQYTHPARPERMIDLFCQFLHSQEEGFSCSMEADLLVARMLIELAFHGKMESGNSAVQRLTQQVRKIVDTEYHKKDLCPGIVAQRLDVNRDYLGRVFKQAARETIGNYIIHRRLREARKLLLESELNVNQVAHIVGFQDPGYFRRLFRKHFDMKPVELRRLYFRTHVNVR